MMSPDLTLYIEPDLPSPLDPTPLVPVEGDPVISRIGRREPFSVLDL